MQERPYIRTVKFKSPESLDWASYPYVVPAVNDLESIKFHPQVTFFVGENGSGKSTILEALALALGFSEEGGTRNVQLNTATTSSDLHQAIRTIKSYKNPQDYYFLRAESFYNVATYMKQVNYLVEYGGRYTLTLTWGGFLKIINNKIKRERLIPFR